MVECLEWRRECAGMIWPEWLELKRIPDALLAQAYGNVSPAWRQALKTGIALAHFHFGSADGSLRQERENCHLGFAEIRQSQVLAWTIVCVSRHLDAPARICAALVLPLLAGVQNICLVFLDHKPSLASLLAPELCGMEDVYELSRQEFEDLLKFLATKPQCAGKLFFLGKQADPDLLAMADGLNLRYASSFARPKLLLQDPDIFNMDLLEFLHGAAPAKDPGLHNVWDCVFASSPPAKKTGSRLVLCPGCEGFWLFNDLAPEAFLDWSGCFQMLPGQRE